MICAPYDVSVRLDAVICETVCAW